MSNSKGLIIGICMIISFFILGLFYYKKHDVNAVRVVGQASERVLSDRIKWTLVLNKKIGLNNTSSEYLLAQNQYNKLKNFLLEKGVKESEINLKPIISNTSYGDGGIDGYMLEQTLIVISENITLIESLALDMTAIYEQNLTVQSSNVSYYISDNELPKIKQNLLEKASKDAKERAEAIARSSELTVESIFDASAGVFQINEPYGTDFAGYGIYNTSVKEKDISVTVRASFKVKKN